MSSKNQRIFMFLVAVFGIITLAAPGLRGQQASNEQPERFQRSFNVTPGGTSDLDVNNYKGTIHITGSDTNQVVVDVTKRFDGSGSDRKWWMENVQINFRNDNNHVSVEVKYPQQNCIFFCWQSFTEEAWVELEIHVPRQMNVKVESYKPDIKVAALQGDIRIKSYKSPIEIDSTTGAVRIDTYKETIKLRNVAVRGPLDISSYKADVEIDAKSLGETARVENYKGSTVLRLPTNTGLDVDFDGGRHADFHSDFPMASRTGGSNNGFRGKINQGGTRLHLRTERGSVSLEKLGGY